MPSPTRPATDHCLLARDTSFNQELAQAFQPVPERAKACGYKMPPCAYDLYQNLFPASFRIHPQGCSLFPESKRIIYIASATWAMIFRRKTGRKNYV
jgi:hypothetical protein